MSCFSFPWNYFCDCGLYLLFTDDNIDETYGVNVQFESDEEVRAFCLFLKNHTT